MEVREGYKKTEVGVIPEEWDYLKIERCVSIETGSKNTEDKINDGEYPFFVRSQQVERINSFSFDCEAVLTAGDGVGTGKIFHFIKGKFDAHQRVYVMSNFNNVTGKYFFYYFSNTFYEEVCKYTAKSSVDSVRRDMIAKMLIPIPPLPEQQAIATALSDIDNLINSLTKLIDKKKNIKQGVMQELLKPKVNWIEKRLGETAVLKARIGWQGLTTAEYQETGEHFLITGTDFDNGFIKWDKCHYVNLERYNQDKNIQVRVKDVLVTKDGTIGKVALIDKLPKSATLNSGVFVIRPINKSFLPEFIYYILLSEVFIEFLAQLSAGSTITHLYQKDFVDFKFKIPPTLEEQEQIATILFDMDAEIEALEEKLNKYKSIKQGMMHELLTGRIRLV